jgi:hypothetical protein
MVACSVSARRKDACEEFIGQIINTQACANYSTKYQCQESVRVQDGRRRKCCKSAWTFHFWESTISFRVAFTHFDPHAGTTAH